MLIIKDGVETGYLTPRESEIANLLAFGWEKKEVAELLYISVNTVTNITAKIYDKIGVRNIGELSSWWCCNLCPQLEQYKPKVSLNRKSKIVALLLLILVCCNELFINSDIIRVRVARSTRTTGTARSRKVKEDNSLNNFEV